MAYINGKNDFLIALKGDSAFIRYSAYADGTDFTEEWSEGQNYIGVATGTDAPTDKSEYEWSMFSLPYEINPLYVRKGGVYTIKAVRDNDDSISTIKVQACDNDGEKEYDITELAWLVGDGTEKMFSFTVMDEDCENGLRIECTNCTCTMYSTYDKAIEALKLELDEAKLDKVNSTTAGAVYQNKDGTTRLLAVNQYPTAGTTLVQRMSDGRVKIGSPKESNDAIDKTYADGTLCEYERDIPYYDNTQELPTVLALDRIVDGALYDIVNIIISGYVNLNDGRACYFNHDITRQVQGVSDKGSFKMAGICSSNGSDDLSMYDFKVDVVCEGETFKMQTTRLIVGTAFEGMKRASGAGNLSNVKVRTILARKINVI